MDTEYILLFQVFLNDVAVAELIFKKLSSTCILYRYSWPNRKYFSVVTIKSKTKNIYEGSQKRSCLVCKLKTPWSEQKIPLACFLIEAMSVELSLRDKSILEHYFFRSHVH